MAILRGPLLQDQTRRVLSQKCPTKVKNVQSAVGTTGKLWRKVISYHREADHGCRSNNCYNGPRQNGRQRCAQDQGKLGCDEQHRDNSQYCLGPHSSSSDAMDRRTEQPGTAAKYDRHYEELSDETRAIKSLYVGKPRRCPQSLQRPGRSNASRRQRGNSPETPIAKN